MSRLKILPVFLLIPFAFTTFWSPTPQAQVCESKEPHLALQYLRRLSLDLRGYLPTPNEAKEVIKAQKVPEKMIDTMLDSPELLKQLRDYHRDLLWANIGTLSFDNDWRINKGNGKDQPYWSSYTAELMGRPDTSCLDKPAEFKDGKPVTTCSTNKEGTKVCQEGYVMVKPYYAPDTEVKVCAFDAQGRCGKNLEKCQVDNAKTQQTITKSLINQLVMYAESLYKSKRPYTDLITAKDMYVNGPLSHFMRHQMNTLDGISIGDMNIKGDIPVVAFHKQEEWKSVDRGTLHSGILTMPAYLLRFASNRGRADRFYNSFLCKPFQAPPGGLPPGQDTCHKEPNLQKRCGCKYCHATLEPAAAHWGRWLQSGINALDLKKFQSFNESCAGSRVDRDKCKHYFTKPSHPDEERYRGYLKSYLFLTDRMRKNVDEGPIRLAKQSIESGAFSTCATQQLWTWFSGTNNLHKDTIQEIAGAFKGSKYSMRTLIKTIVTRPEYRLGRLHTSN